MPLVSLRIVWTRLAGKQIRPFSTEPGRNDSILLSRARAMQICDCAVESLDCTDFDGTAVHAILSVRILNLRFPAFVKAVQISTQHQFQRSGYDGWHTNLPDLARQLRVASVLGCSSSLY